MLLVDDSQLPNERLAYGVGDLRAVLPFSRSTIYRLMEDGTLRYRQCGGRRLILRDDLIAFLDSLPTGEATS